MRTEAECYKVLGVEPGSTLDEVRTAYRRAACRYHPDLQKGDSLAAELKLRELIVAYKFIARRLDPAAWSRSRHDRQKTYTPQDFAREGYKRWQHVEDLVECDEPAGFLMPLRHKEAYPTRNETLMFAALWGVAIVMGIIFGCLAATYRTHSLGVDELPKSDLLISIMVGEAVYFLLAAGAVVLVVLTRKLVRLTLRLGSRWLFLPGPAAGRTLPAQSKRIQGD
jgi:hypothetical protein